MKRLLFKSLYDFCNLQNIPISRGKLIKKAVEIAGGEPVRTIWSKVSFGDLRGLFIYSDNIDSDWYKNLSSKKVILLSDDLKENKCWERFINAKEAMHLFDDEDEMTKTSDSFSQLLVDIESRPEILSKATKSDTQAVYMALACLCPESKRLDFERKRKNGLIDDYGIAYQLKIPESHVPKLFSSNYLQRINILIGEDVV